MNKTETLLVVSMLFSFITCTVCMSLGFITVIKGSPGLGIITMTLGVINIPLGLRALDAFLEERRGR